MKLTRLRVKNFKSFKKIDVSFGNFNVIIGANASGKSNFVSLFKFLKDIVTEGLEDAISLQGGINWVRNVNSSPWEHLAVELFFDTKETPLIADYVSSELRKKTIRLRVNKFHYLFELRFLTTKDDFRIIRENLESAITVSEIHMEKGKTIENPIDKGKIYLKTAIKAEKSHISVEVKLENNSLEKSEIQSILPQPPHLPNGGPIRIYSRDLPILRGPFASSFAIFPQLVLRDIELYDINPKLAKKSSAVSGKKKLEPDGRNLALVLRNALKNPATRKTITSIINGLLPFVYGLEVERISDRMLSIQLSESYCKEKTIPSILVSDGTINLIALATALITGPSGRPLVIIEEPDKNLHPSLIGEFVDVLKDLGATKNRQLIITTHNPQIVKYSEFEDLLLISRKGYFSNISKPIKSEDVEKFLQSEMGLDQLFIQNLLE
jgi:predicted ATPase